MLARLVVQSRRPRVGPAPHPFFSDFQAVVRRPPRSPAVSGASLMSDRDESVVDDASAAERPVVIPSELPVLPLRDTVLYPNSFMPLAVAREASVRLIDEATSGGRMIGVFTQREASVEEPLQEDLYPIGV